MLQGPELNRLNPNKELLWLSLIIKRCLRLLHKTLKKSATLNPIQKPPIIRMWDSVGCPVQKCSMPMWRRGEWSTLILRRDFRSRGHA